MIQMEFKAIGKQEYSNAFQTILQKMEKEHNVKCKLNFTSKESEEVLTVMPCLTEEEFYKKDNEKFMDFYSHLVELTQDKDFLDLKFLNTTYIYQNS